MVSMAGGMARRGALPIVHSFACFLAARPNEQIYNQGSESTKVIYVASLAGLLPGGPGHSHQSVRDISALAAVPGLVMAEPSAEAEVQPLLEALAGGAGSGYLRLVSVKWPLPYAYPAGHLAEVGTGWTARAGSDGVVFAYGPWLVSNACQAAEDVEAATGASLAVVVLPWLNRVDEAWLRTAIGARRTVITLDNHYVQGGQGEMVAAAIARLSLQPSPSVTSLGVTSLPECGTNDEVLQYHGLDIASLAQRFRVALEPSATPGARPAGAVAR
jgi:transketolase